MTGRKFLKSVAIIFGILSFFIYFGIKWLTKSFGNVSFEQLLWNATNNNNGADLSIVRSSFKYVSQFILYSAIWSFFVTKFEEIAQIFLFIAEHPKQALKILLLCLKRWSRKLTISYFLLFVALLSLSFFCIQVHRLDKRTQLGQFVSSHFFDHSEDFIEQNIFYPKIENVTFSIKKDLVVVLAESMETSIL